MLLSIVNSSLSTLGMMHQHGRVLGCYVQVAPGRYAVSVERLSIYGNRICAFGHFGISGWLEVRTRPYWDEKSLSSSREEEQKMLLFSNFENLQTYISMQYCGTLYHRNHHDGGHHQRLPGSTTRNAR